MVAGWAGLMGKEGSHVGVACWLLGCVIVLATHEHERRCAGTVSDRQTARRSTAGDALARLAYAAESFAQTEPGVAKVA